MHIKYIFAAVEIFIMSLFLSSFPIICSGNIAGIAACLILLVITVCWNGFKSLVSNLFKHMYGKIIIILLSLILILGIIYVSILSILMYKAQNNTPENPNVIVVLGCKVNGETPSRMLKRRLNAAYEALCQNPKTICIVSGGQGDNEKISEAQAMKTYLEEKGIESDRIIMEDKSCSTYENIKFSLEILDNLNMSHNMTLVTDGFHQYRASLIARSQGVEEVTAYSAKTEPRFLLTYWVREWLGLTHFFILGN